MPRHRGRNSDRDAFRSDATRTYAVCSSNKVVGYYSLAVGSVEHRFASGAVKRNMPQPNPVMILARCSLFSLK